MACLCLITMIIDDVKMVARSSFPSRNLLAFNHYSRSQSLSSPLRGCISIWNIDFSPRGSIRAHNYSVGRMALPKTRRWLWWCLRILDVELVLGLGIHFSARWTFSDWVSNSLATSASFFHRGSYLMTRLFGVCCILVSTIYNCSHRNSLVNFLYPSCRVLLPMHSPASQSIRLCLCYQTTWMIGFVFV